MSLPESDNSQSVDERIEGLEIQVRELKVMMSSVLDMMNKADKTIDVISQEVGPMLEDIRSGGIMKLLSGGFGKRKP